MEGVNHDHGVVAPCFVANKIHMATHNFGGDRPIIHHTEMFHHGLQGFMGFLQTNSSLLILHILQMLHFNLTEARQGALINLLATIFKIIINDRNFILGKHSSQLNGQTGFTCFGRTTNNIDPMYAGKPRIKLREPCLQSEVTFTGLMIQIIQKRCILSLWS